MRFIKLNECKDLEILREAIHCAAARCVPDGMHDEKVILPGDILWDAGEISLGIPEDLVFMSRKDALDLLRQAKTRGELHTLDFALREEEGVPSKDWTRITHTQHTKRPQVGNLVIRSKR